MFRFQKLEVYQLSKDIVKYTYSLTKRFPEVEKYALIQQMNRAAVSVPSNIAEGVSRRSDKDKAHFVNISYSSLMELICQMEIALDLGYIDKCDYNQFAKSAKNLSIKMSNFVRTLDKP